jgi:Rod binding domain-containing protein
MTSAISSAGSTLASTAFMTGDPDQLRNAKPEQLATQFESVFVSMLLKEMRQASPPGEGLFPGDSSDTYGGMFDMYMGQHLAQQGGIGLAASIQAAIEKKGV